MERAEAIETLRQMAIAAELLDEELERAAALREAGAALAAAPPGDWDAWRRGQGPLPVSIASPLAEEIGLLVEAGPSAQLVGRLLSIPPGIADLLDLEGLDGERVRRLWHEAGIVTLQQLRRAALRGQLAERPGFDADLQERLLGQILRRRRALGRWLRPAALEVAARREERLRATRGIGRLERAGELRRALETVERIVWVAEAADCEQVAGRLVAEGAEPLDAAGDRLELRFPDEPPLEIVVVEPERFCARLFLETGAPAHARDLLGRLAPAWEEGWLPRTEEEIYARAGLAWVPPELREGRGEIAAAGEGALPALIEPADLQGVFHLHTTWSDGRATIAEQVEAARRLGWRYIGIADHSQAAFYARGLDAARLAAQAKEIARVQAAIPEVRIFHGVECDIQPDGALDLDPGVLARLDFVIVSVHSFMQLGLEPMTARVVRAIENPCATILGHPSGRLLLEREACRLDWPALFAAAAAAGVLIEFNTSPQRMDLDWRLIRAATAAGVRLAIDPDAHQLEMLDGVAAGVATARKGWLTKEQVLNTAPRREIEEFLHARRCRCSSPAPAGIEPSRCSGPAPAGVEPSRCSGPAPAGIEPSGTPPSRRPDAERAAGD